MFFSQKFGPEMENIGQEKKPCEVENNLLQKQLEEIHLETWLMLSFIKDEF